MASAQGPEAVPVAGDLLAAQSHVFHHILSHVGSYSLMCAVQLGIPDAIHAHGGSLTLSQLASELALPVSRTPHLLRLMRLLAQMGYFSVEQSADGEESYSITVNSKVLLKGSPSSLASWVLGFCNPDMQRMWQFLSSWYRQDNPQTTIELCIGKPLFEAASDWPEFSNLFNETMAGDTRVVAKAMLAECGDAFRGLRSLVDVGGGNGTMAKAVVDAFPHIKCTIYDLPHVVATVPKSASVEAVGGNMFEYIPRADAVLLKLILHDWTDEQCVKILKLCKEAIPAKDAGGKVMIVDIVQGMHKETPAVAQTKMYWDMMMLAATEGKERSEQEWEKLFMDAGFSDYRITPLGLRCLIEVFP